MWRKVLPVMCCLTLLFLFAAAAQAATQVIVDGKTLSFDTPPVLANGRMLVPLRSIFEALDAIVNWDEATQTITATKDDINVKLVIGGQAYKNGQAVALDVPAKLVDGRTLVPLRFVSEALGANVDWNNGVVTITSAAVEPAPATEPLNANPSSEVGTSDYQRFAEAFKVLDESYVQTMDVKLDINWAGQKMAMTSVGYMKQVKVSEQDIETEQHMVTNMKNIIIMGQIYNETYTTEEYFKDGYEYSDNPLLSNEKTKTAMPSMDGQSNVSVLGFDKSKIKDVKVIGNSFYYTIDKSGMDFPGLTMMMNALGSNGELNYSDINFITTLDNENKLKTNMKFSADTSINGQKAIINCEITAKVTQVGNVTIDFPDDLDSYTEVAPDMAN